MYQFDPKNIKAFSNQIRKKILDLSFYAGSSSSHFGGALSSADIVAVLFGSIMNFNKDNFPSVFEKIRRSRNFSIVFGREDEQIKKISNKYKDVEIAEKLAIFNSNSFLQISINQGNANSLLGLKFYDTIRIEFL